ncbi:MAG: RNA-binding transcriptional accessory protein [Planctomycetes bacterium]|nr:RNA-binding transcriptional accessory protein [Planctomycetota bacterium]
MDRSTTIEDAFEYKAEVIQEDVLAVLETRSAHKPNQTRSVVLLHLEGCTVPFIARYRKERTGGLDEVGIAEIIDEFTYFKELLERRQFILKSIADQGKLTEELRERIEVCFDKVELEDIYLPYKRRKKTRADKAREKGLAPLAEILFAQDSGVDIFAEAEKFVNSELGVGSIEEALQGAKDIVAEEVAHDTEIRAASREIGSNRAFARVSPWEADEEGKYTDYVDFEGDLVKLPAHNLLALFRGERERKLKLPIEFDESAILCEIERKYLRSASGRYRELLSDAFRDSMDRLLLPSVETDVRATLFDRASEESIGIFARNLEALLFAAPLPEKSILAVDPGFRTGCKLAVLDPTGKFLESDTIYPTPPNSRIEEAEAKVMRLLEKHDIEIVAVGNGTASRETQAFLKSVSKLRKFQIVIVNESGASIYSASEIAREEFPSLDVTVRGAISIGRRLQDPLAELVKIDPKSIGVGQYQHDVDQKRLKESLRRVVERVVNRVGVNLNTASAAILGYISGLTSSGARKIVEHRNSRGRFESRSALREVGGIGAKTFEQCAGFLRIADGRDPLDNTAVHPESYEIARKMLADAGIDAGSAPRHRDRLAQIRKMQYATETVGIETITDIIEELMQPGRDPRGTLEVFAYADGVESMEDLSMGMRLPGVVTNVTKFGAFVDVGVHQDGLVHISQLADRFVNDPSEVVKVGDRVNVRVLEVDVQRKRIALSMRSS